MTSVAEAGSGTVGTTGFSALGASVTAACEVAAIFLAALGAATVGADLGSKDEETLQNG